MSYEMISDDLIGSAEVTNKIDSSYREEHVYVYTMCIFKLNQGEMPKLMGPQRLGLSDKASESPTIHEKFITKPSFFSFKTIPRLEKPLPISLVSTVSLGFIKASPSTWHVLSPY